MSIVDCSINISSQTGDIELNKSNISNQCGYKDNPDDPSKTPDDPSKTPSVPSKPPSDPTKPPSVPSKPLSDSTFTEELLPMIIFLILMIILILVYIFVF